jgi:hypothetical protein
VTDVHGEHISVSHDGGRIQVWRSNAAFPVLELDVDEAIALAIEVERAVDLG